VQPSEFGPLRVFIGWDSKEPLAFAVAAHSILRRSSRPVQIIPLALSSLRKVYTRERGVTESTEFSLTRFLVPYLSGYHGLSVFMDCDVLVQADIYELLAYPLAYPGHAVFCCQHDYIPKALTKFDGHEQTKYPRKNWSSVMLFVNDQCQALTPGYVNAAPGLQLHRFHWLTYSKAFTDQEYESDSRLYGESNGVVRERTDVIGSLPLAWNWLVGEYEPNPDAKILHYTNGGIWQRPEYSDIPETELWLRELDLMLGRAKALGGVLV